MEKKFGKNVIVIAQRRILQKPGRNNRVARQKRPNSRTLTSVHDAMLDEMVYPADITGKRIRYKLDGSKQLKVLVDLVKFIYFFFFFLIVYLFLFIDLFRYLDKKDKSNLEDKLDTFCAVFKKLTGKDTVFTFESQFR